MGASTSMAPPPHNRYQRSATIAPTRTPSGRPHTRPPLDPVTTGPRHRSLHGSASADVQKPRRFPDQARTPPPTVRAHPNQHSYAELSLGPPTSCGSTGQDQLPDGNPRSHVSEAPAHPIPSSWAVISSSCSRSARTNFIAWAAWRCSTEKSSHLLPVPRGETYSPGKPRRAAPGGGVFKGYERAGWHEQGNPRGERSTETRQFAPSQCEFYTISANRCDASSLR